MNLEHLIAAGEDKKVYRDGDFIIKVFEKNYDKAMVLNEALNNARVENIGLNVPTLEGVEMVDGKWSIIYQNVEGKTISDLLKENPDREEELMGRFVDIQLEVLGKSAPLLTSLTEKLQKRISASGLEATTRYDLHCRLDSMKKHTKVCHGDFYPTNVIITPDDKAYILDWNHATQGNGAADVAETYISLYLNGRPGRAELYLKLYCQKSDTAKQYVQKWIPIVAAAHLSRPNLTEEARSLLRSWADVVDYQ
ncbi:MAG: phosphotransferase [Clostridia bacterium]|nr:phosphotransferase [Clostridia bacterium]